MELPGYPILGDGKGDNQNHAIPFMRGVFTQCIDANQGAYFDPGAADRGCRQVAQGGCAMLLSCELLTIYRICCYCRVRTVQFKLLQIYTFVDCIILDN